MSDLVPFGAYVRVSTAKQAREDRWSLPAQRRELAEEARRRGWELTWYADEGISGESLTERPAMQRLLDDVRERRVRGAVAVEMSRFSRSDFARDWSAIFATFEAAGATLCTPGSTLDPSRPDDAFVGGVLALVATRERQAILERAARGLRQRARSGRWSGEPPYGYALENSGARRGFLLPREPDATTVRTIYALALDGRGFSGIADELMERGIAPPRQSKRWYPVHVRRVLDREVYAGVMTYGGTRRAKRPGEAIRVEDAHEAIVGRATWDAVQARIRSHRRRGMLRTRRDSTFLLSGLATCPCGGRLCGTTYAAGTAKPRPYYQCQATRFRRGPGARCRRIPAGPQVLDQVCEALRAPAVVERVRAELVEQTMRGGTDELRRRTELESTIAECQRRTRMLFDDRAATPPRISHAQYAALMAEVGEREEEARRALDAHREHVLGLGRDGSVDGLLAYLEDVPRVMEHLEPQERRALLRELLSEVRVRMPDRVAEVVFRVPGLGAPAAPDGRAPARRPRRTPGSASA